MKHLQQPSRSAFRLILFTLGTMLLPVWLNVAGVPFTEITPAGLAAPPQPCVVWGDYDGDGDLDLLVAGLGKHDVPFTILYKNTAGTFTDSGIVLLGLSRATAAWGDFDGDGDLDLAMTGLDINGLPATRLYRNDGGVFTPVAGNFTGVFAGSIAWGDYDGDGHLDLLITGITSSTPSGVAFTRLYHNDGGGVFTSVAHPFPNCYVGSAAWGDYNHDGKLDLAIVGATTGGGLVAGIWRNEGGGVFTNIAASLPGMDLGFVAWGDYDNDGDLDLLFSGNSNDGFVTRIYRNDGGTFTDINAGLLPLLWCSGAWGDYDNDGDLDIMISGYDPVAQVRRAILYRNDEGAFVDTGSTFHNVMLGVVSWADYDNDGNLDLLVAGNDNGLDILSFYHNDNATKNSLPGPPTNLSVNVLGTSVNFSWNAASDAQTPTAGLTYNLRVGTTPGGAQIVSPHSSSAGYRQVPVMGNAGTSLGACIGSLKPGTNYYWSVQAVDSAFAGSPFAGEGTFTALADRPSAISIIREGLGNVRATFRGTPGSVYQVMASTDLPTWTFFSNATADTNGFFSVVDSTTATPAKYYRAARP
jgi:hypothetical protein